MESDMRPFPTIRIGLFLGIFLCIFSQAYARNPIRNAFFNVYPGAETTRLDDVPSNANHCGVCHLDFDGSGTRNAYGLAVEVARNSGQYADDEAAIQSLENLDSDGDGFLNITEITDILNFGNTPTFPGLAAADTNLVSAVTISDIAAYLVPSGGTDTTPPVVTVLSPNGGENYTAATTQPITWSATDASGVAAVHIHLSDDNGLNFKPIAINEPNDGTFDWHVHNLPGASNIIRVVARDNAGNYGSDWSDAVFTITGQSGGTVATTLRDFELPGSQPHGAGTFEDPDVNCRTCHGDYDSAVEPWYQWKGSMMAQAARDPLFFATVVVAEQDAPSSGDLCLRCHTPGGWLEGRSVDTSGGQLNAVDRQGVQCDYCHRSVDPIYKPGISPIEDVAILDSLDTLPLGYDNGEFVVDPKPIRRGPYADADASHAFLESPFHTKSDKCGTCHDVSNPVFVSGGAPDKYDPAALDAPHPDADLRNMFPIERTFSEWTMSDYANGGVFAPQFAGNKPDGMVSTCQDCHMRDVSGKGCNEPGAPTRADLPQHDLTGGNYFVPDILPTFFPGEVDVAQLQAGKQRAIDMLQLAASIALAPGQAGVNPTITVTITNETAHKLPSGYPEGRRAWLNVRAYDVNSNLVYESGAYDASTGVLTHDADSKIYEIKPGISNRLAPLIGLPAGPSFHFVLNDTILNDNRIPPRGFTNANYASIQSSPVAYAYADGQHWDETLYVLPEDAVFVEAKLYYQTTSKEYVEFLRDENVTNTMGQQMYDAWVAQGRCAPVTMAEDTVSVTVVASGIRDVPSFDTALYQNSPNPFNPTTTIPFSLAMRQHVTIRVYDVAGGYVRTLVDETRPAGQQRVSWNGTNAYGEAVASGVYFFEMVTGDARHVVKAVMLK
jgi:hypothetical protein